jgi:hypothetical protein
MKCILQHAGVASILPTKRVKRSGLAVSKKNRMPLTGWVNEIELIEIPLRPVFLLIT